MPWKNQLKRSALARISLCAVVLLVLGSLSNVVGYQSVKSTVNDSPLFATRTQRATNQQQNILTSQYIGMDEGNFLQFPIRYSQTEQIKKVIDIISKMNDKTFNQFIESCIQKVRQDKTFSGTNNEIIQMLQLLRKQSKTKTFSIINRNNQECGGSTFWTYEGATLCGSWPPGCGIYLLFTVIILVFIIFPIDSILDFLTISGSYYCENPS
jgi:hypothetical protein